jgi:tetratricopeptide (TPR) repeat protein
MTVESDTGALEKLSPVERLADIADAMFERAGTLDSITLTKKNDEALQTIHEMRDEGFQGVINVWRVIIDLLPTCGLDQPNRKTLEMDGYKIISRCYHRLNNLEAAKQAITRAIDLGYADGFISLGAICMDCGHLDEAEKAFQSAIAKEVQLMRAHAGLGELYFKLGTDALTANTGKHALFFEKSEEQFLSAGKERFGEGYERAMELFETIGWRDKALAFGEKAAAFYDKNRVKYGDRLKTLSPRIRKIAGDDRYDRFLHGLGRGIGTIVSGGVRNIDKETK